MKKDDKGPFNRVLAYIRKSSEDKADGEANKQLNSFSYQRNFVKEAITKYDLKLQHAPFDSRSRCHRVCH